MTRETIDITYADLRPSDLVIDKSGQAWPLKELDESGGKVWFWLCDPMSKMKMHFMGKASTDPVKVSRLPTQADEAAKLEAEFPDSGEVKPTEAEMDAHEIEKYGRVVSKDDSFATMAEAVAAVEEIGGTVEAEVTAAEVDAAGAATGDATLTIISFADMTPLEQRSHLYLLHGVYGSDLVGKVELGQLHDQAHATPPQSGYVPHVHA